MGQQAKLRVPGASPAPVQRDSGFTPSDAPPKEPERPVSPIPAALAGVEMLRSNPADLEPDAPPPTEAELAQARAMASAMSPIARAFERVADSMERVEVKPLALPNKNSAPMYEYADIEGIVREGRTAKMSAEDALRVYGLELPLLTTKGWLIELGPRFGV